MAGGVVLQDDYPSMYGRRVRRALDEKGVQYEYRGEDSNNRSPTPDESCSQENPSSDP